MCITVAVATAASVPRFREEQIAEKLGQILKDIRIPDEVTARIERSLDRTQLQQRDRLASERVRLEQRLEEMKRRMDQAYTDKLDGKIPEDFWQRKMIEWQVEEQKINVAAAGLRTSNNDRIGDAKRILELANKAYFLYLMRKPAEQGRLLRKVLLNCAIERYSRRVANRNGKEYATLSPRGAARLSAEIAWTACPMRRLPRFWYVDRVGLL